MALTPKQEKFCQKYIETGNASEAYRQSYDVSRMKPESVAVRASEQLSNSKVTVRLQELRGEVAKRHAVTVDSLIAELEEARQVAKGKEQGAAMVQATMGKARLSGLDKPEGEGGNELADALARAIEKLPS